MKKILLGFVLIHLFHVQCLHSQDDLSEEEVILQVIEPDGSLLTRKGELVIRPGARATIILTHGFKHNKSHTKALRVLFPSYNTLVFDFRGHGENTDGQCCSFGAQEVAELKAAADFVTHHPTIGHLPVIAYGQSMGASTVLITQANYAPFDAVIVDSPYDSMEEVIKRGLSRLTYSIAGIDLLSPLRKTLEHYMFDPRCDKILRFLLRIGAGMDTADIRTCLRPVKPVDVVKHIETPVFFIGCNQDTLTPIEGIKMLYKQVSHPYTQLWLTDGAGHVGAFFAHPEEYTKRVNEFIGKVVGGRKKKRKSISA